MFARLNRTRIDTVAKATVAVMVAGLLMAPLAFARIVVNTIDPLATVTDNGRHLVVTGPISCTAGERAYVRVTVTQRATGAVAEGHTFVTCTGSPEQWEVHAAIQGRETFQPGAAVATALGRTTAAGATTDAQQWLVAITLVAG